MKNEVVLMSVRLKKIASKPLEKVSTERGGEEKHSVTRHFYLVFTRLLKNKKN